MTGERYDSYRRAVYAIDALEGASGSSDATDELRDAAEGLLLSRGRCAEADGLYDGAASVLVQLIASGLTSPALAERMLDALRDCGPARNVALLHRGREGRTAATAEGG